MHGKPFVLYNKNNGDVVNFSVCIPTMDSIYIMEGSDVNSGKIEAMTALKTTLTGDYSHLKETKSKVIAYLQKNNLKQNNYYPTVEVYSKTIQDIKFPSKWITELYIPIYPKATVTKPVNYKPKVPAVSIQTQSVNQSTEIPSN